MFSMVLLEFLARFVWVLFVLCVAFFVWLVAGFFGGEGVVVLFV